jgi:hypothetical protein
MVNESRTSISLDGFQDGVAAEKHTEVPTKLNAKRSTLILCAVVALVAAMLFSLAGAISLGAGYAINLVAPAIDRGSATIVGTILFVVVTYALRSIAVFAYQFGKQEVRVVNDDGQFSGRYADEENEEDDDSDGDDFKIFLADVQLAILADRISDSMLHRADTYQGSPRQVPRRPRATRKKR